MNRIKRIEKGIQWGRGCSALFMLSALVLGLIPHESVVSAAESLRQGDFSQGSAHLLRPGSHAAAVPLSPVSLNPDGEAIPVNFSFLSDVVGDTLLPLNPSIVFRGNNVWVYSDRNHPLLDSQTPTLAQSIGFVQNSVPTIQGNAPVGERVAQAMVTGLQSDFQRVRQADSAGDSSNLPYWLSSLMDGARNQGGVKETVLEAITPGRPLPINTERLSLASSQAREQGKQVVFVDASYATKDPTYATKKWVQEELPWRTSFSLAVSSILSDPDIETHAVVMTPLPLPTWFIRYFLALLPSKDAKIVAERLHTVALPGLEMGMYPANIAWRILHSDEKDSVIGRILNGIGEFGGVPQIYRAYNVTSEIHEVAGLFGVPTLSAPPELTALGTKSGFFTFLNQPHVRKALNDLKLSNGTVRITESDGFIYSENELYEGLYRLYSRGVRGKFWGKLDNGASGTGNSTGFMPETYFLPRNLRVGLDRIASFLQKIPMLSWLGDQIKVLIGTAGTSPMLEWGAKKDEVLAAIRNSVTSLKFADESMTLARLFRGSQAESPLIDHGFSVEANYPHAESMTVGSPSVGITITDKGPDPNSMHIQDQWLQGDGLFVGMRSPSNPKFRKAVGQIAMVLAGKLHEIGVRGTIGLDVTIIRKTWWEQINDAVRHLEFGKYYYWVVENNQRQIASTPARLLAQALTGAVPDPKEGMLKLGDETLSYMMTVDPLDQDPRLMRPGMQFKLLSFMQGPGGADWAYDRRNRRGVWLYLPNTIPHAGLIHSLIVAHDPDEKKANRKRDLLMRLQETAIEELFVVQQYTGDQFLNMTVSQWKEKENKTYAKTSPEEDVRAQLVRDIVDRKQEEGPAAFIAAANRLGLNAQAAMLQLFERRLLSQGQMSTGEIVPMLTGGYILIGDKNSRAETRRKLQALLENFERGRMSDFDGLVRSLTAEIQSSSQENEASSPQ